MNVEIPTTDEALLASGDDDDFALLYDRHVSAVLGYFMRRTGCAETSADLTAETFAQAFGSRRRFVDRGVPGRAWLFRIAQRQLSRYLRRESISDRARRRLGVPRLELDASEILRVEDLVDFGPVKVAMGEALDRLPESQAAALRLRYLEGRSVVATAAALGCSVGAAKVRISRALVTLQRDLGDKL